MEKRKITFCDIIKKKESPNCNEYLCNTCNKIKYNKLWAKYYNPRVNKNKNICSYLCYNKELEIYPYIWPNIINKKDFEPYLLRPILNIKKDFIYKTEDEINLLNEDEYYKYIINKENFEYTNKNKNTIFNNNEIDYEYDSEYEYDSDNY